MAAGDLAARFALLLPLAAGCSFDQGGLTGADAAGGDGGRAADGGTVPDAAADASPPRPFCSVDFNLVACFDFSAGGIDGSIYRNDATLSNATTAPGRPGHGDALYVNGASLVSVADDQTLELLGPMSVELWLRADAVPPATGNARAGLLDHNGQWGLFLTSTMQVRCIMAGGVNVLGPAIPLGQWQHVACVYDRQTIQLYQNGAAGPWIAATAPNPTSPKDGIRIGQDSPSGDPLTGAIDEIRIWQVARTAGDICDAAGCP